MRDEFAPAYDYTNNYILVDTPSMNEADVGSILGIPRIDYSDVNAMSQRDRAYLRTDVIDNPDNLLNDPILNRAIANDPSVMASITENPTVINYKDKLLIEHGNITDDKGEFNQAIYNEYIGKDGKIDKELYEQFVSDNIDNPNLKVKGLLESDPFWIDDPSILIRDGNYYRIVPDLQKSKIEILNALTRFLIYLLLAYILFASDYEYVFIPILGIIGIVILYCIQDRDVFDKKKEKMCTAEKCNQVDVCQRPQPGNPFMNITMADLMENRDRPAACDIMDKGIRKKSDVYFNKNLFKDVDDVFNRNSNQRQFYTMPSTTIPNDQTGFAKWLYNMPPTCKEDQTKCLRYEDIRFNRFNPSIDRMENIEEDIL
jgi:hypothetical protein